MSFTDRNLDDQEQVIKSLQTEDETFFKTLLEETEGYALECWRRPEGGWGESSGVGVCFQSWVSVAVIGSLTGNV